MAEADLIFDSSMKKKKKKKKAFDPDEILGAEEQVVEKDEKVEEEKTETSTKSEVPDITDDFDADFIKLKKKKKKKVDFGEMGDLIDALPKESEKGAAEEREEEAPPADDIEADMGLDFGTAKKKKKKPVTIAIDDEPEDEKSDESSSKPTLVDNDREYTYDELLERVFDIMREKNPEMVAGEKRRFVMKPPQVSKAGAKKTAFANFAEICKMLHRQPKHLLAFLLAELGTSGSVDGSNSLIIKGRFHQKQLENVLRRYIKEYVTCHTCKSPETILQRDTRLYFLQCETCGSRCSVASIRSGFQAVTGKRAALRAKTT